MSSMSEWWDKATNEARLQWYYRIQEFISKGYIEPEELREGKQYFELARDTLVDMKRPIRFNEITCEMEDA